MRVSNPVFQTGLCRDCWFLPSPLEEEERGEEGVVREGPVSETA